MKISIVHSFYSSDSPSGENVVVRAQADALTDRGHEVQLVAAFTDIEEQSPTYKLRAAGRVATGFGRSPLAEILRFRPDVVHIHNLFPNFGVRWTEGLGGIPFVVTLHNFRATCAAGTLFRDGNICRKCLDGSALHSLQHGCYRGSRFATAPLTGRHLKGIDFTYLLQPAAAIIVLSERVREVWVDAGVDDHQLVVVPNFVSDYHTAGDFESNKRWLYAGRLTREKGVLELAAAWTGLTNSMYLDVIGAGPLATQLKGEAYDRVHLRGTLPNLDLRRELPLYEGLIVPSLWFENLPTVFLEALAAGLPIIAVKGNSVADAVEESGAGVVVPSNLESADLGEAINQIDAKRVVFATAARNSYEDQFSQEAWLKRMEQLYTRVSASGS